MVDPCCRLPATAGATVRTTETAYTPAGPGGTTTAARIVTFGFGILQALLILRIILLMLVANPGNGVVDAIFAITQPFVDPFIGMFSLDRVTAGQSVLDVAAIVALIAWTLVEALHPRGPSDLLPPAGRGRLGLGGAGSPPSISS